MSLISGDDDDDVDHNDDTELKAEMGPNHPGARTKEMIMLWLLPFGTCC